jgi:superoxide reductase
MKFYRCKHCGNLFAVVNDGVVLPNCCGETMTELQAGVTDGAVEKHVPVIERAGNKITVKVGSVPHPMMPEHHIEWIAIEYNNKFQLAHLDPAGTPEATFLIENESTKLTAYEYCNIHGLWKFEEA